MNKFTDIGIDLKKIEKVKFIDRKRDDKGNVIPNTLQELYNEYLRIDLDETMAKNLNDQYEHNDRYMSSIYNIFNRRFTSTNIPNTNNTVIYRAKSITKSNGKVGSVISCNFSLLKKQIFY